MPAFSGPPLAEIVEQLRRHPRLGPQVAHATYLPGQDADFAQPPSRGRRR